MKEFLFFLYWNYVSAMVQQKALAHEQAAVYIQAPADEIGTAAGLQRTAGYIGAIAATSLLGLMYGKHATDHGLHSLAIVMGVLSAFLFIATIFDRTLPRTAND